MIKKGLLAKLERLCWCAKIDDAKKGKEMHLQNKLPNQDFEAQLAECKENLSKVLSKKPFESIFCVFEFEKFFFMKLELT